MPADPNVPGDGSIVITPKEFYDSVQSDIGEIKKNTSGLPATQARVDDHEKRLTKLERVAWLALGAAITSGAPELARLLGG